MIKKIKNLVLITVIAVVVFFIWKSIYDYYKLKSYKTAFENISGLMWSTYDVFFYNTGKDPDNEKEYSLFLQKAYYENNGIDIKKEYPLIFKTGIFIDEYNDKIVIYTSNRKNIKKYKKNKYIWNLDSISYFDYIFSPVKIGIFQIGKLNMCSNGLRGLNLYKNNQLITDRYIKTKIYKAIKDAGYFKKFKSNDFFYLYGKSENKKYHFSVLCNESNYNYSNLIIYADSVYNSMKINQEIDDIYIPFNVFGH